MTDEAKRIVQDMREWHEAFRRKGKGDERCVKAFLETADMIESLSAELEQVKAERDRYWEWIKAMGCETCSGDCSKCDGTSGWVWSGETWSGEKEE